MDRVADAVARTGFHLATDGFKGPQSKSTKNMGQNQRRFEIPADGNAPETTNLYQRGAGTNVTEANILKGFARIQKPNLEFSSIRCDSEAAGSAMIAAGGSLGVREGGMEIGGDVTDLVACGGNIESADHSAQSAGEEVRTPQAKKPRLGRQQWFDHATVVPEAERAHSDMIQQLKVDVQHAIEKGSTALAAAEKDSSEAQTKVASECATLQKRLECLRCVHTSPSTQGSPLQTYIENCTPVGSNASDEKSQASRSSLQQVPPCNLYQSLVALSAISEIGDEFKKCDRSAEIKALQKKAKSKMPPIVQLIKVVIQAATDLHHARETHSRPPPAPNVAGTASNCRKGKAGGKGSKARTVPTTAVPVAPARKLAAMGEGEAIFQTDAAKPMIHQTSTGATAARPKDVSTPCVFKLEALAKNIDDIIDLPAATDAFVKDFFVSDVRKLQQRGGKPISTGPFREELENTILKAVGSFGVPDCSSLCGHLADLFKVSMWAVAAGAVKASTEPEGIATLRYQVQGTRVVAVINYTKYLKFMVETRNLNKNTFPRNKAAQSLKHIDASTLVDFMKQADVYRDTIGPVELLFIPTNSLILERVMDADDAVGYHVRGVFHADTVSEKEFMTRQTDVEVSKEDVELYKALAKLAEEEATDIE